MTTNHPNSNTSYHNNNSSSGSSYTNNNPPPQVGFCRKNATILLAIQLAVVSLCYTTTLMWQRVHAQILMEVGEIVQEKIITTQSPSFFATAKASLLSSLSSADGVDNTKEKDCNNTSGTTVIAESTTPTTTEESSVAVQLPWTVTPGTDGISTQHFIWESVKESAFIGYGVEFSKSQVQLASDLERAMVDDICQKEKTLQQNNNGMKKKKNGVRGGKAAAMCNRQLVMKKCVSCSTGSNGGGEWYSLVSQAGNSFGILHPPSSSKQQGASPNMMVVSPPPTTESDHRFFFKQIDFIVPAVGQDTKLWEFAGRLGTNIQKFRAGSFNGRANQDVTIRLVVTKDPNSQQDNGYATKLAKQASIVDPNLIVFHTMPTTPESQQQQQFSRAQVLNSLSAKACDQPDCLVIALDVDMDCSPAFLYNAMTFVAPETSVYFPIVWSTFSPRTTKLVAELFDKTAMDHYSVHNGAWRTRAYGMYAMSGVDNRRFDLDETFVGWGGEDLNYYHQVEKHRHIIRMKERGLTHLWHDKKCDGSFVTGAQRRACVGAASMVEGSPLGIYLELMEQQQQNEKEQGQVATSVAAAATIPDIQINPPPPETTSEPPKTTTAAATAATTTTIIKKVDPPPTTTETAKTTTTPRDNFSVLIVVTTCRANFATRVGSIAKTWATNLPSNVRVAFFVGKDPDRDDSGSAFDVENLAKEAGLQDDSMIFVTNELDNEYPPVRKNVAMLREAEKIATTSSTEWIMKVDDDTYVNTEQLVKMLKERDHSQPQFLGRPGFGRQQNQVGMKAEKLESICMGGPGYVQSRTTLTRVVARFEECLTDIQKSKWREQLWHSDLVFSLCTARFAGQTCLAVPEKGDPHKRKNSFIHLFDEADTAKLLLQTKRSGAGFVTAHPFKDSKDLFNLHGIVRNVGTAQK